ALRLAAALLGWRLALLPRWSDDEIAALCGLDRDEDFADAEPEEPACIAVVCPGDPEPWRRQAPGVLVEAARRSSWHGRANQLSPAHVEWPAIDAVARATRYPGVGTVETGTHGGVVVERAHPVPDDGPRA